MRVSSIVICLLVVISTFGPHVVQAAPPSISVFADGDRIEAGSTAIFETDPSINIEVSADASIQKIIIRIDGDTVQTYSPNSDSVTKSYGPDLKKGENEFTVIAKDANGDVESYRSTLIKDRIAPFVGFTSPFESDVASSPPDSIGVQSSVVNIAGQFEDHSGVDRVEITRTYTYSYAGSSRKELKTYRVNDPGESFSKKIFLGDGDNQVRFRFTDKIGNVRKYEMTFRVNDNSKPHIALRTPPQEVRRQTINITGKVTDNVQIDSITYEVEDTVAPTTFFTSIGPKPEKDRRSIRIDREVNLVPGQNRIVFSATDVSGNTATKEYNIFYNKTIIPFLLVNKQLSNFNEQGDFVFNGSLRDGEIKQVNIETVNNQTREVVDHVEVYPGNQIQSSVAISETLATADGLTKVIVRFVDSKNRRHTREFLVNPDTQEIHHENERRNDEKPQTKQSGQNDTGAPQSTTSDGSEKVQAQLGDFCFNNQTQLSTSSVSAVKAPERPLLLDQSRRQIGTVTLDGTTYTAYRYENLLPYASRVSIYSSQGLVTSKQTSRTVMRAIAAKRVIQEHDLERLNADPARLTSKQSARQRFRKMAWHIASQKTLARQDIGTLRQLESTSETVKNHITPPLNALDFVLEKIDQAKSVGVWQVATTVGPGQSLKAFENLARTTRSELQDWHDATSSVDQQVPVLISSIQKMSNCNSVEYSEVSNQFSKTTEALESFERESAEVRDHLQNAADETGNIAEGVAQWPVLADPFRDLSNGLTNIASEVEAFRKIVHNQRVKLTNTKRRAQSMENRMMDSYISHQNRLYSDWETRKTARNRVNFTLGGGGLVSLISFFFGYRFFSA